VKHTLRLAIWAAATWFATAATAGGTYRISGVVVNSLNGKPLAQTRVMVASDDGSAKEVEMTTAADGRFLFEGLPAGSFTLSAERKNYLFQKYGQHADYASTASSVMTGPGGVSEGLTFTLYPQASIRGKVVDERGEPVWYAHMQLLVQVRGARNEFLVRKVVPTDDTGEYRFSGLPPMDCQVLAVVPITTDGEGLAPEYYSNITDPNAVTPIHLKPGEEFVADFILRRSRGVKVTVDGPSGIAGGNTSELMVLFAQGPQGAEVSANTLEPGSGRTFYHVQPGRYKLLLGDVHSTFATSHWIDVGQEDVTVKLPFPDPPEVTARVRVVNGDAGLLQKVMLRLHVFNDAGNNTRPLGKDGTAVFPAMASGRYAISLGTSDLYVKSVTARNAKVIDGLLDLPDTGPVQLEIVAAGDAGSVKGKVVAQGKPVCGANVVLAPATASENSADYHGYQSDSDGTFDFRGVKPGDYLLFATDDWQLEFGNRAAIQKYLREAKAVKAAANGVLEMQIEPLTANDIR